MDVLVSSKQDFTKLQAPRKGLGDAAATARFRLIDCIERPAAALPVPRVPVLNLTPLPMEMALPTDAMQRSHGNHFAR